MNWYKTRRLLIRAENIAKRVYELATKNLGEYNAETLTARQLWMGVAETGEKDACIGIVLAETIDGAVGNVLT